MKKFFRNGFWQKLLTCLFILFELAFLILTIYLFAFTDLSTQYALIYVLVNYLISLGFAIYIINSSSQIDYKVAWLFLIILLPLVGVIFYLIFAHKRRSKRQSRYLKRYYSVLRTDRSKEEVYESLKKANPDAAKAACYIESSSDGRLYQDTSVRYFPLGDDAFPFILDELKKAKHYIFLEFFIITPGIFWNSVLQILEDKVKEGVDVRIIYDDVGNLGSTPVFYPRSLQKKGIKCYVYRPLKPILDVRTNNRNHRKILVIDGHTCFTGGINIADEYINQKKRFGHWKDNAILIKGKAVYGYTLLFLADFITNFGKKSSISSIDYNYYRPDNFIGEIGGFPKSNGYILPYGDLPYADHAVGEGAYLQMIGLAKNYLYITTPYLILDDILIDALRNCALSGVDVRIITPGVPDKKVAYQLTRYNYGALLQAGVKIYEYTPGFVHAKTFICDDHMSTIGTINLDYRSLFLHMENGTFIAESSVIKEMRDDFLVTQAKSEKITYMRYKEWRKKKYLLWLLLRIVAPMF